MSRPSAVAAVAAVAEKMRVTERVRGAVSNLESWRSRRRVDVVVPVRDTMHAISTPLHAAASAAVGRVAVATVAAARAVEGKAAV